MLGRTVPHGGQSLVNDQTGTCFKNKNHESFSAPLFQQIFQARISGKLCAWHLTTSFLRAKKKKSEGEG